MALRVPAHECWRFMRGSRPINFQGILEGSYNRRDGITAREYLLPEIMTILKNPEKNDYPVNWSGCRWLMITKLKHGRDMKKWCLGEKGMLKGSTTTTRATKRKRVGESWTGAGYTRAPERRWNIPPSEKLINPALKQTNSTHGRSDKLRVGRGLLCSVVPGRIHWFINLELPILRCSEEVSRARARTTSTPGIIVASLRLFGLRYETYAFHLICFFFLALTRAHEHNANGC